MFLKILQTILPFVPKIIDSIKSRRAKKQKRESSEFNESPMVHIKRMDINDKPQ
jgi:hypothetical protein